jgi:hypothetical protein
MGAEVNKPKWVSFCGWVFIACLGVAMGLPLFLVLSHARATGAILSGYLILISVPMAVLWALGSLVHKLRVQRARLQSEALRRVIAEHKGKVA